MEDGAIQFDFIWFDNLFIPYAADFFEEELIL